MFDIIFISYQETNADKNWKVLLRHPNLGDIAPERVHDVKGIARAHKEAAKLATSEYFFCVDADNIVHDDFNWKPELIMRAGNFIDQRVHVWACDNPVNGLRYGYGGVKLFPTKLVLESNENVLDYCMTTATSGFKYYETVASTTHFNTSEFEAWRGAFRECVKLASMNKAKYDENNISRMKIWCSLGEDAKYGQYALLGARVGVLYGTRYYLDIEKLKLINDFDECLKIHNNRDEYFNWIYQNIYLNNELRNLGYEFINFSSAQSEYMKRLLNNG